MQSRQLKEVLDNLLGKRDFIRKKIEEDKKTIFSLSSDKDITQKSKEIVILVKEQIMNEFRKIVEEIVSQCLTDVYQTQMNFRFDIEIKRNQVEFTPIVETENGIRNPRRDMGGGVNNIIGFALRVIFIKLTKAKPIIILDEPFRFLGSKQIYAAEMMKQLSEKFGIQFIVISHDEAITSCSDKSFEIIS